MKWKKAHYESTTPSPAGADDDRMASTDASDFRLSVLNPGGRDLEQYFDEPVGPTDIGHPPINLHAFAACTRGSFHRATKNAIEEKRPILLLLRGNFRATERALAECQKQKRTVAVALKETGLHQIAAQLRDPGRLARFLRIVAQADGCIATTPEAAEIFCRVRRERHADTVAFIPTLIRWKMSNGNSPLRLTNSREFSSGRGMGCAVPKPSRDASPCPRDLRRYRRVHHRFNLDGRRGEKLLAELKFPSGKLLVHDKREPYGDYLRQMARHKIVLQLDRSRVPGQVAGDALLCRTICLGSDGAIERLAFANFCGKAGPRRKSRLSP